MMPKLSRVSAIYALFLLLSECIICSPFTLVMMGARRGGNLKRRLNNDSKKSSSVSSLNKGRGQEITGVSLPAEGSVKGWEFGSKQRLACANVEGNFYVVQGECPRCAFDLFKGDIITDPAFGDDPNDLPRIACPTCATTFSLRNGKHGPAVKRTGLAGFVGGLAKTATSGDATADAKAFKLTVDDESGRVFINEK
jgi:nitrite reductase/ring-hydroxylating ferredoxin subunit